MPYPSGTHESELAEYGTAASGELQADEFISRFVAKWGDSSV
jgi:hypothetical protein